MSRRPDIVSLLPAATEIVCALGLEERLAGRSHECDFPPGVDRLPVCSRPRLDVTARSAAIDRQVRTLVEKALAVYEVDACALRALAPAVVLTQTQCEACAASEADVQRALCEWLDARPRIVSLEANDLEGVWNDVGAVAAALGAPDRGERLIARLRRRVDRISGRAGGLGRRPSVACIEWVEPLMAAGNWLPELVERAGGDALFGSPGEHSPRIEWDGVLAAGPDVILVMPCGFDLERTRREAAPLARLPGWEDLAAAGTGVYLCDGHHYFNRPGPRLVESLEILAEVLHPEAFDFGHLGGGWEPFRPVTDSGSSPLPDCPPG